MSIRAERRVGLSSCSPHFAQLIQRTLVANRQDFSIHRSGARPRVIIGTFAGLAIRATERIRVVRVFQDGAVYVPTDGAGGTLLKLTPK